MADPCPSCSAPLSLDGTFCKSCGYDVELAVADWRGEGADLGDEDAFDYEATLRREGLAGGNPVPWGRLAMVLVAIALLVGLLVLGRLR